MYHYNAIPDIEDGKSVPVIKTKNKKIDAYMSRFGGFVRGTSTFLTGTSGAGKTTFSVLLQSLCRDVKTALWSREMLSQAVARQCSKYDLDHKNAFIADSNSCPTFDLFMETLETTKPDLIIVDSLQVIAKDFSATMGEDAAIKHIVDVLRKFNERNNSVLIFIGQMTKSGIFKGPQDVLQLADAHLKMTFYPKRNERTLSWGGKNRNVVDPTEIMFYTIGDGEMKFYSPIEWEIERRKLTYIHHMMEASFGYLKALSDRDGYDKVSKELRKVEKQLSKLDLSDEEFFFRMTKEINEAITKAWPAEK